MFLVCVVLIFHPYNFPLFLSELSAVFGFLWRTSDGSFVLLVHCCFREDTCFCKHNRDLHPSHGGERRES